MNCVKNQIKNFEIVFYKDAGHGGIFQYHEEFRKVHSNFLNNK
jgi:hypothetical protein